MAWTHAQRKALGDFGERLAARYLEGHGLRILDRNWRCSDGEIDIVATDGDDLVVCEVKTRSSAKYGTPLQAITANKAGRLHRLGHRWAGDHQMRYRSIRVDVVSVRTDAEGGPRVEHFARLA